ncbi:COX20 [[Candida] subhashii]|uniref:Cytochrome c oxidase assembly protein COX20, mitochondrial n=1 Tax=[Candida] subhashii TaxID=561895 RepID=A0A8J5QH36_9ASCO|nr:COX20 [[Candida] subhashii]KAG7664566.1 COX20 [[Candida] subhashii]
MGWFGGSSSSPAKVSVVSEYTEAQQQQQQQQQFLEDLPPKFQDDVPPQHRPIKQQPTIIDVLKDIKLSDFTIERFTGMPCFREGMITGFQAMSVLGIVTFFIRKNISQSMNWAVGGFFLGNVLGFEQCRSVRRRSYMAIEKAKQLREAKNRAKWDEMQQEDKDEDFEKFQQFNSRR